MQPEKATELQASACGEAQCVGAEREGAEVIERSKAVAVVDASASGAAAEHIAGSPPKSRRRAKGPEDLSLRSCEGRCALGAVRGRRAEGHSVPQVRNREGRGQPSGEEAAGERGPAEEPGGGEVVMTAACANKLVVQARNEYRKIHREELQSDAQQDPLCNDAIEHERCKDKSLR